MGKKKNNQMPNKNNSPGKESPKGIQPKSKAIAKKPSPGKGKPEQKKSVHFQKQNSKHATNGFSKETKPQQNPKSPKKPNQKGPIESVIKASVKNLKEKKVQPKNVENVPAVKKIKPNSKPKPKPEKVVESPEPVTVTKIDKRQQSRLKSEMKKEIILKGKNPLKLAEVKLLEKKLAKLEAKAEPRSVNVQRKILLINKLLAKAKVEEKKKIKSQPKTAEEKTSKTPAAISTDNKTQMEPPKNKFVVFIGHLPPDITKETLEEHFSSVGEIQRTRIPKPKKRKNKLYAYMQLADQETRDKALALHGTKIGEREISVFFADKKRGKNQLNSENGKLETMRKAASMTDKQTVKIGKKINKNKKNNKNKAKKGVK